MCSLSEVNKTPKVNTSQVLQPGKLTLSGLQNGASENNAFGIFHIVIKNVPSFNKKRTYYLESFFKLRSFEPKTFHYRVNYCSRRLGTKERILFQDC